MYVSINLDKLVFMHKSDTIATVAGLAWIEAHDVSYEISDPTARAFLGSLTDMELKVLYLNTTGQETYYGGDYIRAILGELAQRLPNTDADPEEVESQALYVNQDSPPYRYVKGARTPTAEVLLWSENGLTAEKCNNEPTVAATNYKRYELARRTLALRHAASAPTPPAALRLSTGGPPSGTRRRVSGIRERVWAVADSVWAEIGNPTEKSAVLAMRKNIMNNLEQQGIKRTSSSNELGKWQNARIPKLA